jgi:hypothetical protein
MSGSTLESCTTYAIAKPTIKKQGMYTPLPTPSRPRESVSMDYMSGLPSTKHGQRLCFRGRRPILEDVRHDGLQEEYHSISHC